MNEFDSAATRMLLACEGMTTPLLQAVARTVIRAQVDPVVDVAAGRLPASIRCALRLTARDRCRLRRSQLTAADGQTLSHNLVVAREDLDAPLRQAIGDRETPLGFALANAGVTLRRRILRAGRARWPGSERLSCACKTYTLDDRQGALIYICERFNPSHIPAAIRAARWPDSVTPCCGNAVHAMS
ncbi:hypothetical protein [Nonomuraea jabiensis]|uniref:Chorismate lyase n=1 Tax=Nonomuraea jabiensis TaxID=882448 RepID=A0A7W9G188_9ACTN|nr:hypothetical protein [Nonomuraea jabiensis]MBB5775397.1 hypothetical protein [Nonomuraea jabiensis]